MTWRGLPPFRDGVRVVPIYCARGPMVRVDVMGGLGFDVRGDRLERLGELIEAAKRGATG